MRASIRLPAKVKNGGEPQEVVRPTPGQATDETEDHLSLHPLLRSAHMSTPTPDPASAHPLQEPAPASSPHRRPAKSRSILGPASATNRPREIEAVTWVALSSATAPASTGRGSAGRRNRPPAARRGPTRLSPGNPAEVFHP